jgi:hypothetical protein
MIDDAIPGEIIEIIGKDDHIIKCAIDETYIFLKAYVKIP